MSLVSENHESAVSDLEWFDQELSWLFDSYDYPHPGCPLQDLSVKETGIAATCRFSLLAHPVFCKQQDPFELAVRRSEGQTGSRSLCISHPCLQGRILAASMASLVERLLQSCFDSTQRSIIMQFVRNEGYRHGNFNCVLPQRVRTASGLVSRSVNCRAPPTESSEFASWFGSVCKEDSCFRDPLVARLFLDRRCRSQAVTHLPIELLVSKGHVEAFYPRDVYPLYSSLSQALLASPNEPSTFGENIMSKDEAVTRLIQRIDAWYEGGVELHYNGAVDNMTFRCSGNGSAPVLTSLSGAVAGVRCGDFSLVRIETDEYVLDEAILSAKQDQDLAALLQERHPKKLTLRPREHPLNKLTTYQWIARSDDVVALDSIMQCAHVQLCNADPTTKYHTPYSMREVCRTMLRGLAFDCARRLFTKHCGDLRAATASDSSNVWWTSMHEAAAFDDVNRLREHWPNEDWWDQSRPTVLDVAVVCGCTRVVPFLLGSLKQSALLQTHFPRFPESVEYGSGPVCTLLASDPLSYALLNAPYSANHGIIVSQILRKISEPRVDDDIVLQSENRYWVFGTSPSVWVAARFSRAFQISFWLRLYADDLVQALTNSSEETDDQLLAALCDVALPHEDLIAFTGMDTLLIEKVLRPLDRRRFWSTGQSAGGSALLTLAAHACKTSDVGLARRLKNFASLPLEWSVCDAIRVARHCLAASPDVFELIWPCIEVDLDSSRLHSILVEWLLVDDYARCLRLLSLTKQLCGPVIEAAVRVKALRSLSVALACAGHAVHGNALAFAYDGADSKTIPPLHKSVSGCAYIATASEPPERRTKRRCLCAFDSSIRHTQPQRESIDMLLRSRYTTSGHRKRFKALLRSSLHNAEIYTNTRFDYLFSTDLLTVCSQHRDRVGSQVSVRNCHEMDLHLVGSDGFIDVRAGIADLTDACRFFKGMLETDDSESGVDLPSLPYAVRTILIVLYICLKVSTQQLVDDHSGPEAKRQRTSQSHDTVPSCNVIPLRVLKHECSALSDPWDAWMLADFWGAPTAVQATIRYICTQLSRSDADACEEHSDSGINICASEDDELSSSGMDETNDPDEFADASGDDHPSSTGRPRMNEDNAIDDVAESEGKSKAFLNCEVIGLLVKLGEKMADVPIGLLCTAAPSVDGLLSLMACLYMEHYGSLHPDLSANAILFFDRLLLSHASTWLDDDGSYNYDL